MLQRWFEWHLRLSITHWNGFPILYIISRKVVFAFGFSIGVSDITNMVLILFLFSYVQPCKHPVANFSVSFHLLLVFLLFLRDYLWTSPLTPAPTTGTDFHSPPSNFPHHDSSVVWVCFNLLDENTIFAFVDSSRVFSVTERHSRACEAVFLQEIYWLQCTATDPVTQE